MQLIGKHVIVHTQSLLKVEWLNLNCFSVQVTDTIKRMISSASILKISLKAQYKSDKTSYLCRETSTFFVHPKLHIYNARIYKATNPKV